MRSPDEIKKGLEIEISVHYHLPNPEPRLTPREFVYMEQLHKDALYYITQLEQRLAQADRERDAALSEWKRTKMDSEGMCWTCKHGLITDIGSCRCISPDPCDEGENWEWRGVCEENSQ